MPLRLSQTADTQPVSTDGEVQTLDTVVVVGQRAMMESAINMQRSSDTVESVLTRDKIGQFPDQNVAESIRRLPGINILDDQGEGRFVSVRGLDPTLNDEPYLAFQKGPGRDRLLPYETYSYTAKFGVRYTY